MVLGRHIEQLSFLQILLGDRPALTKSETFYQRVLGGDTEDLQEQAEEALDNEIGYRQDAETKAQALAKELESMRATMEQYVSQLQGGHEGDADRIQALIAELNMVRTQASMESKGYQEKITQLERQLRKVYG